MIESNNKITIGFLGNQIAPGGGSTSLLLMIKSLDKSKYNIFVLASDCASEDSRKEFLKYSSEVIVNKKIKQFISCAGHKPRWLELCSAYITIRKQSKIIVDFIRQNNIDILHINNAVFAHLYKAIKNRTSVIIISHLREQIHLYNTIFLEKFIIRNINMYSDKILAISDNEAKPFDKNKVEIVPNPFDFEIIDTLNKKNFRDIHSIKSEVLLVAMMGRFSADKGQYLFIQIANYLNQIGEIENILFVIFGTPKKKTRLVLLLKKILLRPDFYSKVLNYIEKNGLSKKILMIPYTKDILQYANEMDIFIRPSLFMDPWGRDVIETMALGKCVIATGNSQFLIKDGFSGLLINSLNPQIIGDKILGIIKNRELMRKIGANAKKEILDKSNLFKYGARLDKIFQITYASRL